MARRIRELEQGLDEVYATISNEKHPLLSGGEGVVASGSSTPRVFASPSPIHCDPSSVHQDDITNHSGTPCAYSFYHVGCESSGSSRHAEHRPKRQFVLLRRDGQRRSEHWFSPCVRAIT